MIAVVAPGVETSLLTPATRKVEVEALVTGESVAQVSSQTLVNLAVISDVTRKMLLRPKIAMIP